MPHKNTNEIDKLLTKWEGVYKKGLLSFWILLLLHERPAYAYKTGAAIGELSQGTILADENSIYRALNRFETLGVVKSELRQSNIGPPRRYYSLTETGISLLTKFIQRNILVFETSVVRERIHAALDSTSSLAKEV